MRCNGESKSVAGEERNDRMKRYWFRKNGALHWAPICWQGWAVTGAFVVAITAGELLIANRTTSSPTSTTVWGVACVAVLMTVVLKTSEPS
jgi:hypothetical protein